MSMTSRFSTVSSPPRNRGTPYPAQSSCRSGRRVGFTFAQSAKNPAARALGGRRVGRGKRRRTAALPVLHRSPAPSTTRVPGRLRPGLSQLRTSGRASRNHKDVRVRRTRGKPGRAPRHPSAHCWRRADGRARLRRLSRRTAPLAPHNRLTASAMGRPKPGFGT